MGHRPPSARPRQLVYRSAGTDASELSSGREALISCKTRPTLSCLKVHPSLGNMKIRVLDPVLEQIKHPEGRALAYLTRGTCNELQRRVTASILVLLTMDMSGKDKMNARI